MQIRWRGLELPSIVARDDSVSSGSYGRFVIEPFEQGFGTTIGNSIRRVLLSSLEGAAVTSAKIAGVSHEFTSMDGVLEDVTDIILNIKGIRLWLAAEGSKTMTVRRQTVGQVCAGDFVCDPAIKIANPDHKIATLTADVVFEVELRVRSGRGYATAADNRTSDLELGVIPVDSTYSPVLRVRYRTEAMRVGQRTNYDRLILEVWTDETVTPEDALVEAGMILRRHLNLFVTYQEPGEDFTTPARPASAAAQPPDAAKAELYSRPIAALNLSVRAGNCLAAARVTTIGELVGLTEVDLLRFRSFGKTSLHEVHRKLAEFGLALTRHPSETVDGGESPLESSGDVAAEEGGEPGMESGNLPDTAAGALSAVQPDSRPADGAAEAPMEVYTMPEDAAGS